MTFIYFFIFKTKDIKQFSDLMMAIVEGKKLDFKSGRQFSRRLYLTVSIYKLHIHVYNLISTHICQLS